MLVTYDFKLTVRNCIESILPGYLGWRNRFLGIDSWAP